ncbi:MAG: DUF1844 domain-containing protein [Candidatus Eisenbacteria bacterium]|nr:DUF1844 domain-containing protein [Candidatus Eisenbacteria bacterium]
MEDKEQVSNEALFMAFILNLHATTMIALGKIVSPLTHKIERNLEQARFTIDLLGMLEAKTAGNRTEEESRALKTVLTELRLNYVDELKKDKQAEKEAQAGADAQTGGDAQARQETQAGGNEQAEKDERAQAKTQAGSDGQTGGGAQAKTQPGSDGRPGAHTQAEKHDDEKKEA